LNHFLAATLFHREAIDQEGDPPPLALETTMYDTDTVFARFENAEMLSVMKRAFDEASQTVYNWGTCNTLFTHQEADAVIANAIFALAQQGVTDPHLLSDAALSRFGVAALDRVASNLLQTAEV
jgi:hypothetical protein